jgi:hypothetical protein
MPKSKVTVVVDENGRVIGTQQGHGGIADPTTGIVASLSAGPHQQLHEIEYDVPRLRSGADVTKFHEQLEKHLKE